jgi:hypothetical protein
VPIYARGSLTGQFSGGLRHVKWTQSTLPSRETKTRGTLHPFARCVCEVRRTSFLQASTAITLFTIFPRTLGMLWWLSFRWSVFQRIGSDSLFTFYRNDSEIFRPDLRAGILLMHSAKRFRYHLTRPRGEIRQFNSGPQTNVYKARRRYDNHQHKRVHRADRDKLSRTAGTKEDVRGEVWHKIR